MTSPYRERAVQLLMRARDTVPRRMNPHHEQESTLLALEWVLGRNNEVYRECADVALAIDSNRGNEKMIAEAILGLIEKPDMSVARQKVINAGENVAIAVGMGWDLDGVHQLLCEAVTELSALQNKDA